MKHEHSDASLRLAVSRWIRFRKEHEQQIKERLQNLPTQINEFGFDSWGFQPEFALKLLMPLSFIYHYYFRVEVKGIDAVPAKRVLLIANHSGQLPIDAMMVIMATLLEAHPPRFLRSMVEHWVPTLPFVGTFMARVGQIVGTPDNCRALLEKDEAILVFPEGVRGISKEFRKRYQLQRFGLGFMRLAIQTHTPIVPVAVIGAEEQTINLYNFKVLARLIGFPALPMTPLFPFIGPLAYIPLPTKYRIYFGQPMHFSGDSNDEDEEINKKVEEVKGAIAGLIKRGCSERKSVFF